MATPGNSRNWLALALALLGVGLCDAMTITAARADWKSFWHGVHLDHARTNAWPQPFVDVDTRQARAPFEVMKHNGWRAHHTIGHELFYDQEAALTAAGNRRVAWIASQAPLNRRTIYVLRGRSHAETEARLASVHQVLASLEEGGATAQVLVTDTEPPVAPGVWTEQISRQWIAELPAPKLPSKTASGSVGATGP